MDMKQLEEVFDGVNPAMKNCGYAGQDGNQIRVVFGKRCDRCQHWDMTCICLCEGGPHEGETMQGFQVCDKFERRS